MTSSGDLDLHGFLGMDESVRNGYERINVTFRIKSDAPEEKLRELVELAQKRSPVFDIVSHPTPVWKRNNKHHRIFGFQDPPPIFCYRP